MRPYVEDEILPESVWISVADKENGSPKEGDMIARDIKNPDDEWLVSRQFFYDHYEPAK